MPFKPRYLFMDKDNLVWEKLDEATDEWHVSIRTNETYRAVGDLILKYKKGPAELMHVAVKGGYNVVYRLEYKDGSSVIMRIPIKGVFPFPDEKVRYEVATMRYIAANTTIPVPHIYHYGTAAENPLGLGPFIIMDYVEHHQTMSAALLDIECPGDERPILNRVVGEEKVGLLYAQMANILLQLSSLKFPRIGSLVEKKDGSSTSVEGRPLIMNMTDFIVHTKAPASILPSQTYTSADEWYKALADMHMAQLTFQHNDAVDDEDDARDKYVARQLFRNLAAEKRLAPELESESESDDGGFTLFSEDFRPGNVLLDKDLRVVGVIDWEFAYAAPAQFSHDPPWWLLLEEPEHWPGGYRSWMEAYEPRLRVFLRVLEAEEKKMKMTTTMTTTKDIAEKVGRMSLAGADAGIGTGARKMRKPLSQRMRESWEKGRWMHNYAARKSWAFDYIWWRFLDESYFWPNEEQDHKARLNLLSKGQREAMDRFVACKLEESKIQEIVEWEDKKAADHLAKLLI